MYKTIEFLVRKPGISREEFKRYYEDVHRPLAFETFPQIVKHVRNYPEPDAPMWPAGMNQPWDCIVEIYYDSREGYLRLQEFMDDPVLSKPVLEDGEQFLDIAKCGRLLVDDFAAAR